MPNISEIIAACEWSPVKYLVFSQNVFDNFIYYSHILPLVVSLIVGVYIFRSSRKLLTSKILLFITLAFSAWTFLDLILWANAIPEQIMFTWSLLIIIEPIIYAACLYFIKVFIDGKDTSLRDKILVVSFLLPTILLVSTRYALLGFDLTNCDREAVEGPLTQYGYLAEIAYAIWIILYALRSYLRSTNKIKKREVVLATVGIILFLMTFSWGNLVGTFSADWGFAQWGLFGMPIFIAFLAYLIVRYKEFNIRLLGAQALVIILCILVGSIFFVAISTSTRIIVVITEIIVVIFGIILVRSVKKVDTQREELATKTVELSIANEKLKAADKLKDEFLSFASHDLKSPVSKMKQWAALIADKTYNTAEQITETVLKIENTADRAIRLVDEFLNIRKIEEGKIEYVFEDKDVVEFVKNITHDFDPTAKQKGLALAFNGPPNPIHTSIDTTKIRQVIENLIDNSIKYTEAGSVTVSVAQEQKTVLISVKDTGGGMEHEMLPKLFEQFHREAGVSKTIQGTGLGLYIAKQFVIAHQGEIWAESEGRGKGSTFNVRLRKI